jgi:uncharacterized DUF497 family protein
VVIEYEFDPAKNARNLAERGLSLALAPYLFEGLVHVADDDRRVISLRKANSREVEAYAPKDHA